MSEAHKRGKPRVRNAKHQYLRVDLEEAKDLDPKRLRRAMKLLISDKDVLEYQKNLGTKNVPRGS